MAVLSKIREKSIFLIIIIGLALFAFVVQGAFKYKKSSNSVGEVNGSPISREEFAKNVDLYKTRSGGRLTQFQAVKAVWNNMLREKIYNTQLQNAGMVIGEEDVWDAIINLPNIKNSPIFKNKAGLFDQEKLKEYLVTIKENAESNPKDTQWSSWLTTEQNIKLGLEQKTYSDLVINGINTTLKEGENYYQDQTTKSDIKYVFVPFLTIPDSIFKITDNEVESYVNKHKKEFKVDASRDLNYVKFEVKPTLDDENAVKTEVAGLINNREEYSSAAKTTIKVLGLKSTTGYKDFFAENNSDLPFSDNYLVKAQLPKKIADSILIAKVGDIIGPYKEKDYYMLTKVLGFKQIPDSVKASHILISYKGALRSSETRTVAEAKKIADSIFKIVKNNKKKFAEVAKQISYDKQSGAKGGELGWFTYNTMIPKFRDFVFFNKTGKVGVVKTDFGYHIIRIENQKNFQKVTKVANFGRKIEASDNTENNTFEKAETFTSNVTSGKNFIKQAKEKGYAVKPIYGIKKMNESLMGLKNQRQIVNWTFKEDTKVGDIKRFDTENGYVIVQLSNIREKGLMPVAQARTRVRRILYDNKKSDYIKEGMGNLPLDGIAVKYNTQVRSSLAVSLASPVIPNVGNSIGLIGAVNSSQPGKILRGVKDVRGVFAVKILKREAPIKLPNYDPFRKQISRKSQLSSYKLYNALEKEAKIVDDRALYY